MNLAALPTGTSDDDANLQSASSGGRYTVDRWALRGDAEVGRDGAGFTQEVYKL